MRWSEADLPLRAVVAGPAVLIAGIVGLAGCGGDSGPDAPYAAGAFPSGADVSVVDLRGDAVLLAGWATWCVPCERELPALDAYAATADPDLRIVAVNVDTATVDDDAVDAMLVRLDVDLAVWRDREGALLDQYGGTLMPFSVLLDRDGRVVRTWSGALDVDSGDFAQAVADALG